jgi:glycosyltransferase involved in cell wall biosynthesis
MRIAIHADAAAHAIPGGVGGYVRRLVDEALRDPGADDVRALVSRSARVPYWPKNAVTRNPLPLRPLYAAWNVLRRPSVRGFDVVHAPGLVIPPVRGGRLVATINDDTIVRFPDLVPRFWRSLYTRGFRAALASATVLCAISEATKRRLTTAYGVDPDRVVVTPLAPVVEPGHPEDASILERCGIRRPYVLNVGTLEPRKNQATLVRAVARARLVEHQLVIAGAPGWGADEVRDAIAGSGASGREQCGQERHAELGGQQGRGVGTDAVEGSLTDRQLTRVAEQQLKPHRSDRDDGDQT